MFDKDVIGELLIIFAQRLTETSLRTLSQSGVEIIKKYVRQYAVAWDAFSRNMKNMILRL